MKIDANNYVFESIEEFDKMCEMREIIRLDNKDNHEEFKTHLEKSLKEMAS